MGIQYEHQQTQQDAKHSLDEQETIAQTMGPPTQPPPQPPPRSPREKRERWFIVSALLVVLVLVLALGSVFAVQMLSRPATQPTPAPTRAATTTPAPTRAATPTPAPPAGSYQLINALWMSDATTGWARTTTYRLLRTTDGGKSWQDVTPPYPASSSGQFPPAFASLTGSVAWVAVSEKLPDGTIAGVVFRTSDGGHSWQQATLPTSQLGPSQVQFVNAQDGWVLSSPGGGAAGSEGVNLFRSTNGGQTWSLVARAPGALPLQGIKSGMGWISATTGWITGSIAIPNTVYLYRTQDGGVSWQPQALPSSFPVQATQPPVFFSASEGLLPVTFSTAQGPSFAVYATHDGGATWSSSTLLSTIGSAWDWDFLTMQQGWVVGATGSTLHETSDGGQHWTAITPSANFQHISQLDFVSAQEGWAISTATPAAPVLLKTMDGGQTWVPVSLGSLAASWKVVSSPNVGTSFNPLNGVAAVSASNLWAVGSSLNSSGTSTLIEHWNGTSWQVVSSPNVGTYNYLYGVAAVSSTNIWAVGYAQNSSGRYTLIEHWNGKSWQVVSSPNAETSSSQLSGVAALSATNLWAVGYSQNSNGANRQTLIEHWNGSSWKIVSSPNPGTSRSQLSGVTAVSATNLWAVGYYSNNTGIAQTLIEQWNGSSWKVVSSPNIGTYYNELNGVAAVSSTDIWTVGIYSTGSGTTQTLIEQWNGTSWQVVSSPNPGTRNNSLSSVAAVSSTTLWAAGAYANSMSGPAQTLIEHWNGTTWQVIFSPNVGTGNNLLNGVVAMSATNLWAVGTYANNGNSQTLTEEYS